VDSTRPEHYSHSSTPAAITVDVRETADPWYYSTREADDDMRRCPQGVHAFLRAYYHYKSVDWPGNQPFPLRGWIASELTKLPAYYIMELGKGMAETVAPYMPAREPPWLTDEELRIYARAFERTGFQGGLRRGEPAIMHEAPRVRARTAPRRSTPRGAASVARYRDSR
jgi:hypothetical protein